MLETLLRHLDMVRLSAGAIVLVALVGCTGLIEGGQSNVTPEDRIAKQKWVESALPALRNNCSSCHAGSQAAIAFLAGGDDLAVRNTLLNFDPQVTNLEAPGSSRVLTKGAHSGPALDATSAAAILDWLTAEHDAAGLTGPGGTNVITTPEFTPLLCTGGQPGDTAGCSTGDASHCCPVNKVDLSTLGATGAEIDFVAQPLSTDTYVTELYLKGAAAGVYLEHPLFVSWPKGGGDPIPDQLDRFFNTKLNVPAPTGAVACPGPSCQAIGGGTAAFVHFSPVNQMSITFKVVDKYHPDTGTGTTTGGGTTGGCKQLASFKTNAQNQLKTNCAGCHAGTSNPNAKSAMDITGIGATDDATIQMACDQARTRINFTTIDQSGFFIAPQPGNGVNHQFKFGTTAAYTTFHDAVVIWANAEKTSQ